MLRCKFDAPSACCGVVDSEDYTTGAALEYYQYDASSDAYIKISEDEWDALCDQYYEGNNYTWNELSEGTLFTVENIEDAFDVDISNLYGDWIITAR